MAVPIIPIIMAAVSLIQGISQGVQNKKNADSQASAVRQATQAQVNERARQARKLMSQQKASFLKSGVYFEGTPEAMIDETYNTSVDDINAMIADANTQESNLSSSGNSGLFSGILGGIGNAALSYFGAKGFGNLFGGSASASGSSGLFSSLSNSRLGVSMSNMMSNLKYKNLGGFGSLPSSGLSSGSTTKII